MRITKLSQLREQILTTGEYRTGSPAKTRTPPGALTTLRYSWNVMRPFRLCGIYEALGILTRQNWAEFCFSTIKCAEALGMNVTLEGWKNRQAYDGPVMYLCNHMSMTETVFLPPILLTYGNISIVVKNSLAHLPFLERATAHMGLIGINRKSPREDLVKILTLGTERIKGGDSFLIFPQGTRQEVFSRAKFSSIGAKLAERAGCPICPIVIDTRCHPTRKTGFLARFFKDFGPVDTSRDIRCACGPIIPVGKSKAMNEAAFDWMATKLESWGLPTER